MNGAMAVLGNFSSVPVRSHFSVVSGSSRRIRQVINIIADRQYKLICHKMSGEEIQGQSICHLTDDDPGFFIGVWVLQHLTGSKA